MAPVDMALMESGSDNQSEQQSSSRMSRVVAMLVVLGLIGSAFLLGRSSVTASVSQSVQLKLPGTCTYTTAEIATIITLQKKLKDDIAKNPADAWQLCQNAKNCVLGDKKANNIMALEKLCSIEETTCPASKAPAIGKPPLKERLLAALEENPDTKAVCKALMDACADPKGKDEIAKFDQCKGLSPCLGGAKPVCFFTHNAPDLGKQFSCMTAGKPEVEMMKICAIFKAACPNVADQEWLDERPRCNMRIPRHDGRLDYITHEKFEHAVR